MSKMLYETKYRSVKICNQKKKNPAVQSIIAILLFWSVGFSDDEMFQQIIFSKYLI